MVIRNQQRTALIARFQVTFREAPDWWVARGQCDYLTLAVITKLHFDGLQSLLPQKKKKKKKDVKKKKENEITVFNHSALDEELVNLQV